MADVIFDEEQQLAPSPSIKSALGGITDWLVGKKIAKNERQATAILLSTAVVAVVLAMALPYVIGGNGGSIKQEDVNQIRQSTGGTPF